MTDVKQISIKHSDESKPNAGRSILLISEIYSSIQGESTYAGRPCTFIRLTGCPLRCRWCDSAFAYNGGQRLTHEVILKRVQSLGQRLVEVTGGEPLAQSGCPELLHSLCDSGHEVLLETSGTMDLEPVDPRVIKIVDVKCPSSGESDKNRWDQLPMLNPADELKFVVADRADYLWARQALIDNALQGGHVIHFSPVQGELDPALLAGWIIEDHLDVRLHLQLHKIIWPDSTFGV